MGFSVRVAHLAVLTSARRPMAGALADAASLAGWQALDTGDPDEAWSLHRTAQHAAREAEDYPAMAHAMAQQAYVLLDVARQRLMISAWPPSWPPMRSYGDRG
jgi:hypothetical protein